MNSIVDQGEEDSSRLSNNLEKLDNGAQTVFCASRTSKHKIIQHLGKHSVYSKAPFTKPDSNINTN